MSNGRNHIVTAAALLAFAAVSPAHAAPPAAPEFAKATAILGGQSRLSIILAEQGAAPRPAPVQPSSYGLTRAFAPAPGIPARASPATYSGEPDIFGTVALEVRRTPLDDKWRRVERSRVSGRAASFAGSLRKLDDRRRLEAINSYVNGRVRFADDVRQYGRGDVWTTANDTLERGRGDCEDYAIAKLQMLRAAGFSSRDLYLVILRDLVRRSDHAVAVVRSGENMFVLDNGTDRILDSEAVTDYRPILTFAAGGTWTHGYRVNKAAGVIASASGAQASPVVPADQASSQRSRSASLLARSTGFSR